MEHDLPAPVHRLARPEGHEIPYAVLGEGGRPGMVYAHALTGSGLRTGSAAFRPFLDAGWAVATLDQRGHGQATPSTDPDHYRVEGMGRDLIAVTDHLGWSTAWLCGASMGAAPAIWAATAFPDRVEGLVLLAPAFGERPNAAADMFGRIADALAGGGIEAGSAAWRTEMAAREVPEAGIRQHLAQLRMHDPDAMAVWLREIGGWTIPDAIAALSALDLPVAVVAWEDDDIHPAALGHRLAQATGRGAFEVIDLGTPGAGPDWLFRVSLDLVERLRQPAERTP